MRPRLLLLALSFAALSAPLARGANLDAIYRLALDNDATYAAAREAYKAGLEKVPQGRAGLLPNIGLSASYQGVHSEYSGAVSSSSSYNPYGFGLSLVQPLYRKQNLESYEQAKLQGLLAEQQLKVARQDLILRVANAYFAVLQAQDVITTVLSQKQAFTEQLAQAKKSFEVGAATITDTNEAQSRYDLTIAQEIAARNDLEVKRRTLEKFISREAPGLATLVEGVKMPLPRPADMDAWVTQAQESSLSVVLGQTALETARREVEKQRGGRYPTLDLAASYGDNRNASVSSGVTGVDSKVAMLGLELGWNLYQGGAVNSRVREAVANQEKARYQLDDARRQAVLDARQGYLGVLSGDAQVRALEQAVVSSEAQLRSTKLGMEVGVRTRVDVLNALQQLSTTERDLAAARYQTILAGLQLKAAAGTLSEDDLKAVDAMLRDQP